MNGEKAFVSSFLLSVVMLVLIQHFHLIKLVVYRRNVFHTIVHVVRCLELQLLEFFLCGKMNSILIISNKVVDGNNKTRRHILCHLD